MTPSTRESTRDSARTATRAQTRITSAALPKAVAVGTSATSVQAASPKVTGAQAESAAKRSVKRKKDDTELLRPSGARSGEQWDMDLIKAPAAHEITTASRSSPASSGIVKVAITPTWDGVREVSASNHPASSSVSPSRTATGGLAFRARSRARLRRAHVGLG